MLSSYSFCEQFIYRVPSEYLNTDQRSFSQLFEYSQQPFFKEAIYIASPILYNELIRWHKNELTDVNDIEKLIISINKYATRMQSRCTPYGLFAGCGTGKWGDKNEIIINNKVERHSRLDMNYLCELVKELNSNPTLLPLLKFYPNNSIYRLGESIRYAECIHINNSRIYQLSSVDFSDYLHPILNLAKTGATIHELASLFVDENIDLHEVVAFIKSLIFNQILISELEPAITGDEFIYQISSILKRLNISNNLEINSIINVIEKVQTEISNIDSHLGNEIKVYRNIYELLKNIYLPNKESHLFQVDLYNVNSKSTLNCDMQIQLLEVIEFLNKLSINQENSNIKKFKELFYANYGDAEMPLVTVLDTETGIGYKGMDVVGINKLIDDINLSKKSQQSYSINWNTQQEFLHTKLLEAYKNNDLNVFFSDEDIEMIDNSTSFLPDSMPVMFRVINENCLFLQFCGGSSAANLLGRFAHGSSEINSIINEIVNHEKKLNPDIILAEIIHLPESRAGNILIRPVFRDYEIPYLGKSSAAIDKQILLDDLFISLNNDKIILRSKRLNKEIIPRLASAHNYSNSGLPIYQFLCDLQTQYFEKASIGFSWGNLSDNYIFLPRATYKNIVLAKAKWQMRKNDFKILLNYKLDNYRDVIVEWKKKWAIPQYIVFVEGDNELLINLDDNISLRMFISIIKKKDRIIFEEFLFDLNNLFVKDERGNGYTNEFIAILKKNETKKTTTQSSEIKKNASDMTKNNQRDFPIGSEWLYYKLYCGIKTADKLLFEIVNPLILELLNKKIIDKFFFIRYSDPDMHIRLRFHLVDIVNIGKLIQIVNNYIHIYVDKGLIPKVIIDTYNRELERYGVISIELSESLFFVDSITTLDLFYFTNMEDGDLMRWQYAIRSVDDLLDLFNYSLTSKIEFVKSLKILFFDEHIGNKELKFQLDNKFRSLRKDIECILKNELFQNHPLTNLLKDKKEKLRTIVKDILNLHKNNILPVSLDSLISSYTHMMLNRIFNARQRTCELVIYDLLYKHYISSLAQEKSKLMV